MVLMDPTFRRSAAGCLLLTDTNEAKAVKRQHRERDFVVPRPPGVVRQEAEEMVKKAGGDVKNSKHLLACFTIQFGCFRGKTFRWILENSPGYVGYLINGMEKDESKPKDSRWVNKMALKKYVELWEDGKEVIALKKTQTKSIPTVLVKTNVTGVTPTDNTEMSDEQILEATQELEQTMTAGYLTSRGAQREMVIPTLATQRKALLSGASLHVQKPLSVTATVRKSSLTLPEVLRPVPAASKPSPAASKPSPAASRSSPAPPPASKSSPAASRSSLAPPPASKSSPAASRSSLAPPPASKSSPAASRSSLAPQPASKSSPAASRSSPAPQPASLSSPAALNSTPTATAASPTDTTASLGTLTTETGEDDELCLPARWKTTLPKVDKQWIADTLFRWNQKGKAELVPEHVNKLWWYPPQPSLAVNSVPGVDRYFARPLFLWMPRKQWKVTLYCPQPDCVKQELASAGINQKVRQVTDVDGYYNMACDNLECMKCKRRLVSWSHAILAQLDIGHRVQFPCILTARLACDIKVVRLLRNRGLGNSCSQIQKKIEEEHGEKWLQNVIQYLTDCRYFSNAADANLLIRPIFAEPPDRVILPKRRWFMQIFIQDVLQRLDVMKANITSVFGNVLKIDSTKKITKKLAGRPKDTALWCTNVGNEHGQILTSVMTSGEGHGLTPMLVGIIQRYGAAQVPCPEIIYLDRDCCGSSPLHQVLHASTWNTVIRLDIWHFMRRIAVGVTTESHQLYSSFMGLLSNCIFHWDEQDLSRLIESKRNELAGQHISIVSDAEVMKNLSRYELALHCRRTTRGAAETTKLMGQLIETFSGAKGRNTLGVPLICHKRMPGIWEAQKKHIPCLQDPPDVSLYTKIGSSRKGGVDLPNFRCARGSTSLESFHLHLNRFIPGTLASDVLCQAYVVDGLNRWNHDREVKATSEVAQHHSYSGLLNHTANEMGLKVLKRKIVPTYKEPRKYTGELIGIEYLYSQTGMVLDDYIKVIENLESDNDNIGTGDDDELLEQTLIMDDLTVSNVGLKESTDTVLETTFRQPVPEKPEQPRPPSFTKFVSIPTDEDYQAMMRDTLPRSPGETPDVAPDSDAPGETPDVAPDSDAPGETPDVAPDSDAPGETPDVAPDSDAPGETPDVAPDSDAPGETPDVAPDSDASGETPDVAPDSEADNEDSVGPDNIAGYGKVQELATFLISLRDLTYLTNTQVAYVIKLWNDLHDHDKKPTEFEERFSREARGRFKAKKSVRNVVPGVESTERCMRGGPGAVPASWPNANRYTEAIFLQLLSSFPKKRTRYDDVTIAYYNIRQLVLRNGWLMAETNIQLPEISRGTLVQWHTKHGKDQDKLVVMQGIRFEKPPPATSQGVPEALDKPAQLSSGIGEQHVFHCPANTAGTARFKGQRRQVSATQTSSAQPAFCNIAPKSACPVTSPRSTPPLTVPQSKSTPVRTSTKSTCRVSEPKSISVPQSKSTPVHTSTKSTCRVSEPKSISVPQSKSTPVRTSTKSTCRVSEPKSISVPQSKSTPVRTTTKSTCRVSEPKSISVPQSKSTPVRTTTKSTCQGSETMSDSPMFTAVPVSIQMTFLDNEPESDAPMFTAVPLSTQTITTSQPIFPDFTPMSSPPMSTSYSIDHIPARQSSPAVLDEQTTGHLENIPIEPLQMSTHIPYTTQWTRKRKLEMEKYGITKRKYTRTKIPICKLCGHERIPPSHVQYFMNWFCVASSHISFEDWKEGMKQKGYGRKPKFNQ